ncbi:MAG: hypothetical protein V7K40_16625 [Nostoc sp.]|uniref:hypothetical protein n=1 Tax=Nostoc sp. TaxID=1180 RepID=UPI002FF78897
MHREKAEEQGSREQGAGTGDERGERSNFNSPPCPLAPCPSAYCAQYNSWRGCALSIAMPQALRRRPYPRLRPSTPSSIEQSRDAQAKLGTSRLLSASLRDALAFAQGKPLSTSAQWF